MYVRLVAALLGLALATTAVGEDQRKQCNSSAGEVTGDSTVIGWSWSHVASNRSTASGISVASSSSGNLSEIDELLLSGVGQKFRTEFAGAARLEQEERLEVGEDEAEYVSILGQKFFSIHAPFNPAYSSRVSPGCKRASDAYLAALRTPRLWAWRMHDASGKISSGVLNGNINQYGDYDQCLNVNVPTTASSSSNNDPSLQGRYCLAGIQPSVASTALLQHVFSLVQSHGMLKSQLGDPGHRVPRFSTINWGLCVPAACTPQDVQHSLAEFLRDSTEGTGLRLDVLIEPELCEVRDAVWKRYYTPNTGRVWAGFVAYLVLVLLSTAYELRSDSKNTWLTSFSLIRNTRTIFCVKDDPNDVACVHGIRFLNALLLIIAHKSMAMFFNPYTNRTGMSETLGQPWTVIGRAASIFTDPFIMFSGFLTTYSLVGRWMRGKRVKLYQDYIGRLLRIAPPLGALILFCTFVLPFLGSGPQWNLVVTGHGDICKKYWWRNMLFIHNYFGFKDMCLTHTHHVGIDTELFAVSPLFIWALWKWPRKGAIALVVLALVSTVHRFFITYNLRLSNYVYFGTSVKQLFDTADLMYIIPYYRLTVYLMGVLLGYACRVYKSHRLTPNQLRLGWYATSILLVLAFFGPAPMGSIDYQYNPLHAANYAAFSPIAWCIFFAWTVFASQLGYSNKLIELFSWRGFRVTTKISYAIYLTQFPIFFFNVGRVRSATHFNFVSMVLLDLTEYIVIFGASYLLTVLFEVPFSNIKKLLFDDGRRSATKLPSQDECDFNENSNKTIVYPSNQTKDLAD
ncbi:nose resistant to fluoxetine protein 6 isoform X1 [Culex pipiens pallens]|uniref:nose resistant to fluoxetine protein 6 isoform X1 n=2 Tax=Culex pipiens pallens TaxID=42434 RepID=UPI0019530E28|nr:nose resistant to fluoxetine protein 6 isoform X1 [Culex pipiens pallens]